MIEVLVSVIVLSFGLLGVVGLQASALKFTRDARLQSLAVGYGRELAELMRANARVAALPAAAPNPYFGEFKPTADGTLKAKTESFCLNVGYSCTSAAGTPAVEVANAEMTGWLGRISSKEPRASSLPGARVTICQDDAPYDANGLPVWDCTGPASAARATTYIKIGWSRENTQGALVNSTDTGANARPFVVVPVTPNGQL